MQRPLRNSLLQNVLLELALILCFIKLLFRPTPTIKFACQNAFHRFELFYFYIGASSLGFIELPHLTIYIRRRHSVERRRPTANTNTWKILIWFLLKIWVHRTTASV